MGADKEEQAPNLVGAQKRRKCLIRLGFKLNRLGDHHIGADLPAGIDGAGRGLRRAHGAGQRSDVSPLRVGPFHSPVPRHDRRPGRRDAAPSRGVWLWMHRDEDITSAPA